MSDDLSRPRPAPHASTPDDLLAQLGSSSEGLTSVEAAERLRRHGPNALPAAEKRPLWKRYLAHFQDILIYILLAAAVLKAITGDWVDFAVIAVAAVAIATVGFIQEGRAEEALDSIRSMMSLDAQARRDGAWTVVDAEALVPGDVVRLRSGDRVPADLRVLRATGLQADEAALTGESEPTAKSVQEVGEDAGIGDRSSMLHSGTIITAGTGIGVVAETGAGTELGRITAMVSGVEKLVTPLAAQLEQLAKRLSIAIGVLAFAIIVVGRLIHDFPVDELLSAAIGFAVAAVPEGLPALVTITLALGVQQMARRRAITRRMSAVETLGAVTVICSDKTGTLTQNEMTASVVVTRDRRADIEGTGYAPEGRVSVDGTAADLETMPDLRELVIASALCNDARLEQGEHGWGIVGQPTEGALTVLAAKAGMDRPGRRVAQVPFESAHKFAATLDTTDDGERAVHVVGAPDRLLDRSIAERTGDGGRAPLDRDGWERRIEELSGRGLRVLAAAARPSRGPQDGSLVLEDAEDLVMLGLIGIIDPPRPEVRDAIADAHAAGIRVAMITGDHVGTAVAIARDLGIAPAEGEVRALTGPELEEMSQEELRVAAPDVDVYARTSPEHKIRIVRALQSHREVVAMTGDGVNDAPSITRADVGIAMGIKGTEATKEAADIVLADDDFATIEKAVEEGRRIYDNIRKSVVFLLPTNGAQSLVILVAVLGGLALPLSPVQILWINLVTAVTLSLPLATEPVEPGTMSRPPRNRDEPVLVGRSWALIGFASLLIGGMTLLLFLLERDGGAAYAEAQTTAVAMLALGQLAFLFSCRILGGSSLRLRALQGNRMVWIAAGALLVLQLVFTYAPFMHTWFGSAPIGAAAWGKVVVGAVIVFLLAEAAKAVLRVVAPERGTGEGPADVPPADVPPAGAGRVRTSA
ncbi:cation-translocating P-type ATPase [Brachybacterium sp. DNPG3]